MSEVKTEVIGEYDPRLEPLIKKLYADLRAMLEDHMKQNGGDPEQMNLNMTLVHTLLSTFYNAATEAGSPINLHETLQVFEVFTSEFAPTN